MTIQIPDGLRAEMAPIAEEVHRIHESALWMSQGQFEHMKVLRKMNLTLSGFAAALAAVAGGTGLSSVDIPALTGSFALASAVCGAILIGLNPIRRIDNAIEAANGSLALQAAARQLLTITLATMSREDALAELTILTDRLNKLRAVADPPGRVAYLLSKRNINKDKGQTYDVDAASTAQ